MSRGDREGDQADRNREDLTEDLTEVDQNVGMSCNGIDPSTDKHGLCVARPNEALAHHEKRPCKAEPSSPDGAGNEIRTHDFNLGKVALYR